LNAIPLAIAGWLRYLLGVDDKGEEMTVSPDPMLPTLQEALAGIRLGHVETVGNKLDALLSNPNLFGTNLIVIGLGEKITGYFKEMIAGVGSVRATLKQYLG
jgi:fructuronate reductase